MYVLSTYGSIRTIYYPVVDIGADVGKAGQPCELMTVPSYVPPPTTASIRPDHLAWILPGHVRKLHGGRGYAFRGFIRDLYKPEGVGSPEQRVCLIVY